MSGKWIGCGECEAPWICGEFQLEETKDIGINICGLGFFELYLNGRKVSEDILVPVWSDYSMRRGQRMKYPIADERSCRVYYCRYDISDFLRKGSNKIEILLGNGWYNQRQRMAEGEMWYGNVKLWFEMLHQKTGVVLLSSGEWMKWIPSHIVFNNVYIGEVQNFDQGEWKLKPVDAVEAPEGELLPQQCPADRVIREIVPRYLGETEGRRIYDAGENITGWIRFTEHEAAGKKITVRYAEERKEDGTLDFESTGGEKQIQTDVYISAGKNSECVPHFTWHGFRYFEVEGRTGNITVQVVHSDVKVTGSFRCSDNTINWLADAYVRSRLGNMHCGVPSDCPHRERLGYTGDTQAICGADFKLLDADTFYRKWMEDVAAGQCRISGHVQHTAPFYGGGGGPGGWGGAIVLVPWEHYRRYRDKGILEKYYPNMCSYIRYLFSRRDELGLVAREEERGWCLGDWCMPDKTELPAAFVNTYYLVRCIQVVRRVAEILHCTSPYTKACEEEVKDALIRNFYDRESNHFAGGVQGADSFALDIGLGNEAMAAAMGQRYLEKPAFDTGFLATGILIRQLFLQGHQEAAVGLLKSQAEKHSYGWQKAQGATTLWEQWDGRESHNHPMFGSPVQMLFEGLLGISDEEELKLKPFFTRQLSWAEGTTETRFGRIALKWERLDEKILLTVSVPCEGELLLEKEEIKLTAGKYQYCISQEGEIIR